MRLYEDNTVFVKNENDSHSIKWKKTTTGLLTVGDLVLAPDAAHPRDWLHEDGTPRTLRVIDVDGGRRRITVTLA
jgi:hypothetical protein